MFGGLTKTSSRIAIAAALGLTLGGFAFKATPAQAADLGGDCCADLEERVAELEATTVRKGNKKVSVTLSGWVVKSMNFWDDGDDRQLRRRRQGRRPWRPASPSPAARTIAPGWSGGFNLTVVAPGGGLQCRRHVRHHSNQDNECSAICQRQHPHALFLHLRQERHVGRPELGLFEPGIRQPGGACRHFRHRDRIERRCFSKAGASFCGLSGRRKRRICRSLTSV